MLCSYTQEFFLKNILHVPQIRLFVYQFAKDNNLFFEFHPYFYCVKDLFLGAILLSSKSKDASIHSILSIK